MCKIITQYYNFMFVLKQLRRKKDINQSDLAEAIGVSLRTIQLYEKKNANIPIKNLTKIAQFFGVSISQLYAHEVNEVDLVYDKTDKNAKRAHEIRKISPGKYVLVTPFVPVEQQDDYIHLYDKRSFIGGLVKVGFVIDRVSVANYMAFEIANDSMNNGKFDGIPRKSVVLGKQVAIKDFKRKIGAGRLPYWIIVHKDSVMCKDVVSYNKKKNTIVCQSLNASPEFPDFEIGIQDIKQVFTIIKKQID